MIGFDTNVLVRFLTRDDELQFGKALALVTRESRLRRRISISLLVVLETEWVLRSRYGFTKTEIMGVLSRLLDTDDLQINDESLLEEALYTWNDCAADFADCLIGASYRQLGCRATMTFDRRAAGVAGFVLA